jgi:hypothetical protein
MSFILLCVRLAVAGRYSAAYQNQEGIAACFVIPETNFAGVLALFILLHETHEWELLPGAKYHTVAGSWGLLCVTAGWTQELDTSLPSKLYHLLSAKQHSCWRCYLLLFSYLPYCAECSIIFRRTGSLQDSSWHGYHSVHCVALCPVCNCYLAFH